MQTWKTLSRRTLVQCGKYLTVESHTVQLPDGRVIKNWPYVISPDYVNVVPVTPEGQFLCFRQTKYAVEGTSLAPVGGYMEPGEDPLPAARRELREEMGYEAAEWIHLGSYRVGANRGIATGHLFLALGACYVAEPRSDDLEEQDLLFLSQAEVEEALSRGEFKVLGWAANVALALHHLRKRATP
jgi:8-oxo-dGTP pyrophosphatase MutT (NUDIX family)